MTNSTNEPAFPAPHDSAEGREEARLKAIGLVRQAAEQAALAAHAAEAERLGKAANRLEGKKLGRAWKPSGSPGAQAKAAIRKRGGTITTL